MSYIKANENTTGPTDWSPAQFEELQLHAMAALCTLSPILIEDYMHCQGNTRLLLLLEWCVSTGMTYFTSHDSHAQTSPSCLHRCWQIYENPCVVHNFSGPHVFVEAFSDWYIFYLYQCYCWQFVEWSVSTCYCDLGVLFSTVVIHQCIPRSMACAHSTLRSKFHGCLEFIYRSGAVLHRTIKFFFYHLPPHTHCRITFELSL